MPDDDDVALSEKRLYGQRRAATRAYVASGLGVAYVDASDDQIGRFGIAHRCTARDVAGGDGQLLVATDEDVLVGSDEGFEPAGFGPAVAVGVGADLLAADHAGRIARLVDESWETVGRVEGEVRAIDGGLVAASDGVYRYENDGFGHAGLDDARDVSGAGDYAATASGLFTREGDWSIERAGDAAVIASEGRPGDHADRRGHAVVDGTLLERSTGGWGDADAPAGDVVDVDYDAGTFAVTADGTILLDPVRAKDGNAGWRTRSLGLRDVVGVAIP